MSAPIVVMCGAIGSGKTSVAGRLKQAHGFTEISFAEPLKHAAMQIFGLEWRHCFGTQAEKAEPLDHVRDADGNPRTPRKILELLGTEGCRTIDPDVWVKKALRTTINLTQAGVPVVIADARFPNEFSSFRELGAQVWRVTKLGGRQESTGHSSDELWQREPFHVHIMAAAGEMDDLYRQTDGALSDLLDAAA